MASDLASSLPEAMGLIGGLLAYVGLPSAAANHELGLAAGTCYPDR